MTATHEVHRRAARPRGSSRWQARPEAVRTAHDAADAPAIPPESLGEVRVEQRRYCGVAHADGL
ncbi:MAG TPA: hypothetical protein VFD67_00640 [Gemmatimonadaceae bacterium]|nr:hypothetical protein [Gemmatimonadaceae bacterium]